MAQKKLGNTELIELYNLQLQSILVFEDKRVFLKRRLSIENKSFLCPIRSSIGTEIPNEKKLRCVVNDLCLRTFNP